MKGAAIAFVFVFAVSASAQTPDFSGTWVLDTARSSVTATAGLKGLMASGAPVTLHITQPANGTVVIESQINTAHVRIYKPGKQTSTPAGQGGAVAMTTRWEGRTLVSEGALKAANGDTTTVKETVALTADGSVLTVVVNTAAAEKASSTLVYTRITSVGSCESWPTPCKRTP